MKHPTYRLRGLDVGIQEEVEDPPSTAENVADGFRRTFEGVAVCCHGLYSALSVWQARTWVKGEAGQDHAMNYLKYLLEYNRTQLVTPVLVVG